MPGTAKVPAGPVWSTNTLLCAQQLHPARSCCHCALFLPYRVLELDPESADALLGLAMIAFGSTNVQEGLNSGLQYLQRAYAADASHPGVLCVLSHFSMVKGMYEEVR